MPRYVIRGLARGTLYQGASLDAALATLARDIRTCRVEHHGPTDARLYVDGEAVETGMEADGSVVVIPKRAPVELPPSSMAPKWPKH